MSRPRDSEWSEVPGDELVAYPDRLVARALEDTRAINRSDFGKLTRSPHYTFKEVVSRDHWIYASIPFEPTADTVVFWFRRRSYVTQTHDYQFPWETDDQLTLFRQSDHTPTASVQIESYSIEPRASIGSIVVQLLQ